MNKFKKLLNKKLKEHKSDYDKECGEWWDCPKAEFESVKIAPKSRWLMSEERRQRAIFEWKEMAEKTYCSFCDLIKELKEFDFVVLSKNELFEFAEQVKKTKNEKEYNNLLLKKKLI